MVLLWSANGGHGEQLVDKWCYEGGIMFEKMFGPSRLQLCRQDDKDYDDHAVSVVIEWRDY